MRRFWLLGIICVLGGLSVSGQGQGNGAGPSPDLRADGPVADVRWERYVSSVGKISVLLPKNPIVISKTDWCNETSSVYWSYAEEAAYGFTIYYKSGIKIPEYCYKRTEFGNAGYQKRLDELASTAVGKSESDFVPNLKKGWKIERKTGTTWVFDDLGNDRWIELSIIHRAENKVDENRFLRSIDLSGKQRGIEIGAGAERTLGDPKMLETPIENSKVDEKPEGFVIAAKSPAKYTDAARQSNIQGSVTLRVVFQANGTIGGIAPVSGLPYGLTEQAIAAARKIVFLPQRNGGKSITVTKTVQYSFSIY